MDEQGLRDFIESYENYLRDSFEEIWNAVRIEYDKLDAYSVIGGLLSRQVTLSIQMARSPSIWNGHSASLFLRAMTDLHIALAWIMLDLEERSKQYILHGLGEEKLLVEQYKKEIEENPDYPNNDILKQLVEEKTNWIEAQRRTFFVEVNLGNWAHLDYRRMAQESDNESLYKFAYKPFSHAAHNMWPHISRYNLKVCENPLHRYHLVPDLDEVSLDLDFLYRSCKYVHRAYEVFVEKFELELSVPMPLDWWDTWFSDDIEPEN
jgi:hypothetical protein